MEGQMLLLFGTLRLREVSRTFAWRKQDGPEDWEVKGLLCFYSVTYALLLSRAGWLQPRGTSGVGVPNARTLRRHIWCDFPVV
jgi:hypothetical protein